MSASITVSADPAVQYLLRIGDTCLVLAQRLGEWCGHAPMLEEDIALTNMALDLVGQARAVLTRAGELEGELGGESHDEDQLAFLRDERDFRNCTLVELPRGDFAVTVLRNLAMAIYLRLLWQRSRWPALWLAATKPVAAPPANFSKPSRASSTSFSARTPAANGSRWPCPT